MTILELAKLVKELTNSSSEIVFEELPKDDPPRRKPDITKAKKLLNWEPKIELGEGLSKMIEWFKEKGKERGFYIRHVDLSIYGTYNILGGETNGRNLGITTGRSSSKTQNSLEKAIHT
jgi:hypothetical protein